MPYYPQSAAGLNYITYPVGPTVEGATLTSGAIGVKGAYVELGASSPFACNQVWLQVTRVISVSNTIYGASLDLATGAGGAEVIVIPDIYISESAVVITPFTTTPSGEVTVPLAIASSTRLAARWQANAASQQVAIAVTLSAAGGMAGMPAAMVQYGFAVDEGVKIDAGATANTKGSYVAITASTSAVIQVLVLQFVADLVGGPNGILQAWAVDLATGAGGAEVVLMPDLRIAQCANVGGAGQATIVVPRSIPMLTYIAASTRVAMRAAPYTSTGTVANRRFLVALLTGTAPTEPVAGVSQSVQLCDG